MASSSTAGTGPQLPSDLSARFQALLRVTSFIVITMTSCASIKVRTRITDANFQVTVWIEGGRQWLMTHEQGRAAEERLGSPPDRQPLGIL